MSEDVLTNVKKAHSPSLGGQGRLFALLGLMTERLKPKSSRSFEKNARRFPCTQKERDITFHVPGVPSFTGGRGEEGSHSGNHSGTAPAPPRRRALWVLDELAVEMPWIIFNPLPQSLTVQPPSPLSLPPLSGARESFDGREMGTPTSPPSPPPLNRDGGTGGRRGQTRRDKRKGPTSGPPRHS
jgi:hypothetical protein